LPGMTLVAFAPAKVNLYLHVTGRRPDGYHRLDSLVAFADIGDRLSATLAPALSLAVTGPEAAGLGNLPAGNNLVLRAARRLAEAAGVDRGAALRLDKRLPTAAGIGGGSSDAAAALKLLTRLWRLPFDRRLLLRIGAELGADVPACLVARPVWVAGIGERLAPAAPLPRAGILIANPRRPLPTAAVFAARRGPFGAPARFASMPHTAAGLALRLAERDNDLTAAASRIVPEIADLLREMTQLPGALLARMSGSGATCFALLPDRGAALYAQDVFAARRPEWWCAAGALSAGSHFAGAGSLLSAVA
jgi:4-diphosphocytidyl-2-C-methyl-D-erythritol kinase